MTPNFVVWRVICYLSGFCWSQYITTESCQFTNLVLILIVHTTECLCPVSGILVSWYPCLCPRLSEDQSWLSRSRSGTCLLAPVVTPGHWHTGPSLASSRPLIGHLASPLASDWSDLAHCLTGFVVVSPCLWVTLWSALGPASPARCLPQYQEWESRLRREAEYYEEYTLIMRPRDLASIRHSGVRGRLTTQFMAPVSFAAPAPRNFGYLIIERRNIPSQVSKMIMNYPSLETGASNKQRNCLHFSVCIYSLGQTRNKCSNSIKVSRKCNRSPSLPSPQLRIDCLLHKNKNRFPANVSLRRKMAMAMIYGVLLWLPKSFLQESIFSFK